MWSEGVQILVALEDALEGHGHWQIVAGLGEAKCRRENGGEGRKKKVQHSLHMTIYKPVIEPLQCF